MILEYMVPFQMLATGYNCASPITIKLALTSATPKCFTDSEHPINFSLPYQYISYLFDDSTPSFIPLKSFLPSQKIFPPLGITPS